MAHRGNGTWIYGNQSCRLALKRSARALCAFSDPKLGRHHQIKEKAAMGLVTFPEVTDHLVSQEYSQGRGSVLRSDIMEVTKIRFGKGERADPHRHPQEQVMYVIEGLLEITLEDETYQVGPGQATFNPSNAEHALLALADTLAISFKTPMGGNTYEATGDLA